MSQVAKGRLPSSFDDLLRDPIIQAVMQADRIDARELRALTRRAIGRLRSVFAWP